MNELVLHEILRPNLDIGHDWEISNDVSYDFVVKLWEIPRHRRDQSKPIHHYDDSLIK
jgi:hypothetical protein